MAGIVKPPGEFSITPHKVSVCILLQIYAPSVQISLPFPFASVAQHNRLGLFLLALTKSCDDILEPKLDELIGQLREVFGVLNPRFIDHLTTKLSALSSPDDLFNFFSEMRGILGGPEAGALEDDPTHPKESTVIMTTPELQNIFTRTEDYLASYLTPQDDVLDKIRTNSKEQGLRNVAVSPAQGIFLNLLVRSLGAKRILEIGTLGAFSTVCFARGIPEDGKITTLEIDPHCAKVATDHLNLAGVLHKVDLVLGKAQETLKTLTPGYDLIFIDADEESFVDYYNLSKPLVRKGGVILVDNIVLDGRVSDLDNHDSRPEGVRRMLEAIKGDTDVSPVAIPTATRKGYDGMIYMVRN